MDFKTLIRNLRILFFTGILVTLSACGGGRNGDPSPVNSGTPSATTISISDASITEGATGTTTDLSFTVVLSQSSTQPVTVSYTTSTTTQNSATDGTDYTGVNGVLTFDPNQTSKKITVSLTGDNNPEPDETFSLTLSKPVNASITVGTATGTIRNDDTSSPTTPIISISNASITEGNIGTTTDLSFTVMLSESSTQPVTVSYTTSPGTLNPATEGTDYTGVNSVLTFNPSETSKTIIVSIIVDNDLEPDETFSLTLSNPTSATIATATATGTILNDDTATVPTNPTISISDASILEGNIGTTTDMIFTVTLSQPSTLPVTVSYTTSPGTLNPATDGTDYIGVVNSVLTFNSSITSQTIIVSIIVDNDPEPDETFSLTLSNPASATITTGTATGTIRNDDTSGSSGLVSRPSNTTCIAPAKPTVMTTTRITAIPNIAFTRAIRMVQVPGDTTKWFVAQQDGQIFSFINIANPRLKTLVLDFSASVLAGPETGLLGMAFHPDFQNNNYIFLSYYDNTNTSRISRFTYRPTSGTIDINSEVVILSQIQPQVNHNGGHIIFGPERNVGQNDGYLFIGFGDGGGAGDPNLNGQDTTTLHGALLRIDVNVSAVDFANGVRYNIPTDNPFVSSLTARKEIYAYGLRNPWRFSIDASNGSVWLADVGQTNWEEINNIQNGGNYGWNVREGAHPFSGSTTTAGLIDPVAEYNHTNGRCSITGGYVYRGTRLTGKQGNYIYGDYCSGEIWSLDTAQVPNVTTLLNPNNLTLSISSFAQDSSGELYVLDIAGTSIYRLEPASATGTDTIPILLSNTGCFSATDTRLPAIGVIPYDINALFWSDGAVKERYFAIPDNTTITINAENDWDFPIGSILVKSFKLGNPLKLFETRLLMRHTDGSWIGYSYEWNAAETDATLVVGSKRKVVNGQDWLYPSSGLCNSCHTTVAGKALGLETAQLNKSMLYPSTGITANQLTTLDSIGMFTTPLADVPANLPILVNPYDNTANLQQRARAYLHTNCSQCHRTGGTTPANMVFNYQATDASMNICNVTPLRGDLGFTGAKIVTPADPNLSILYRRMSSRDANAMPPVSTFIVDTVGASLLQNWITNMNNNCVAP